MEWIGLGSALEGAFDVRFGFCWRTRLNGNLLEMAQNANICREKAITYPRLPK
jgi:hypothetical protein